MKDGAVNSAPPRARLRAGLNRRTIPCLLLMAPFWVTGCGESIGPTDPDPDSITQTGLDSLTQVHPDSITRVDPDPFIEVDAVPATEAELIRLGPRFTVIAVAAAVSREGAGFLDNFLPCVRRGVIDYRNSDSGRIVTFSGCDLGGGVVLSGSGELAWTESPSTDRPRFCDYASEWQCATRLIWSGDLLVTFDAQTTRRIPALVIDSITLRAGGADSLTTENMLEGRFPLASALVSVGGTDVPVNDGSIVADVFPVDGIHLETIPNPGRSLSALTAVDFKRILFQVGTDLAGFLFDETLESQRGDHVHTLDCGTSTVTVFASGLPSILNQWEQCRFLPGIVIDGTFSLAWSDFDWDNSVLAEVMKGDFTIGGGVPTVDIHEMGWRIEALDSSLMGQVRMTGWFRQGGRAWEIVVDLTVDD